MSEDDFEALFATPVEEPKSPEQDFYNKYTAGMVPRIGNLIHMLNAWDLPRFQFLREKGVQLTVEDFIESKAIPGAVSAKPIKQKVNRPLTQAEFIKIVTEYYLMSRHLPDFMHDPQAPHRRTCSLSKVVDMLCEHESVVALRDKKY